MGIRNPDLLSLEHLPLPVFAQVRGLGLDDLTDPGCRGPRLPVDEARPWKATSSMRQFLHFPLFLLH